MSKFVEAYKNEVIISNSPDKSDNASNTITVVLSDGSEVKLWAEIGGYGIPLILVED